VPRDYKTGVERSIKELMAYGHINVYTPTLLRYLLNTEGFEIEKDLTSVIVPEVIQYNYYLNQKKSKNFITDLKIISKFVVRKSLGKIFGKRLSELLAHSYTVLCKKSDQQLKIF
jgi:hypothetical protein